MARGKHFSLLLFFLIIIVGTSISLSGTPQKVHSSSSPEYLGATGCIGAGCHTDKYESWNQTDHANMAGYLGDLYANGTLYYWVAYPFIVMNETSFIEDCAKCHVTGWNATTLSWPEKETNPGKFLNVQCEVCHEPGMSMTLNYSSTLCGQCHAQPDDLQHSAHNNSLADLLDSDHAADRCLSCMSTQGFLGKTVYLNTTGLESISCAACHDTHSAEYEYYLRYESPTELCGQCHSDYDLFTASPHEEAGLQCTSCHGQGTRLWHGEEEPWFNHTFWIYNTFVPYNQTEPMVCSNCHTGESFDWAVSQLELIQNSTPNLIIAVTQLITEANASIILANQTSGVDQTKIAEALALFEEAETLVDNVEDDAAGGFHNPQALNEATQLATEAKSIAINAMTTANLNTQISTLQADIDNLEKRIDNLESTAATVPYLYGGIGLAIGFIIGAAIIFVARRGKP